MLIWIATHLPTFWKYRKWLAYAAAALAVAGVLAWEHHRIYSAGNDAGSGRVQAQWDADISRRKTLAIETYEAQIAKLRADLLRSQSDSAQLADQLTAAQALSQRLQAALSRARMVTNVPASPGTPASVRLSSAFRVCINAAVTGTDQAVADCEAIGMPAPPAP